VAAQSQRTPVTRPEAVRQANEEIAEKAERYRFRSRVPILCECSDPACTEIILIDLARYRLARRERDFLTVPGHRCDRRAA
jgi:hypothetical protein